MKRKMILEQLMDDWIIPMAIIALVIWAVILLSGGAKPKNQDEMTTPAPTDEPVIVQMMGAKR